MLLIRLLSSSTKKKYVVCEVKALVVVLACRWCMRLCNCLMWFSLSVRGRLLVTWAQFDVDAPSLCVCGVDRVAQVHQEPVAVPAQSFHDEGIRKPLFREGGLLL